MSLCKKIAIIGAGLSGLLLARKLSEQNHSVTVFEKARGVGGRLSTRYADPYFFDHGASSFTVQSKVFKDFLAPFIQQGIVKQWHGQQASLKYGREAILKDFASPRWVFAPNMNSFCKALAEGLMIRCQTEIAPLTAQQHGKWVLRDKEGSDLGEFDSIISTAPPVQTARLFADVLPVVSEKMSHLEMSPCYSLMVGFKGQVDIPWIQAKVLNSPLKRIIFNSTKPDRGCDVSCFVGQTSSSFSKTHVDAVDVQKDIQPLLLSEFQRVTGLDVQQADFVTTHRWRYARSMNQTCPSSVHCPEQGLFATADWATSSHVEAVFHNAMRFLAVGF